MEARTLPGALELIMRERGWSQTDLARELGVSQPWVSQVIRGVKQTSMARATALLSRVGWEVRITPKMEGDEPVKRREFVAAAASVAFVPSAADNPYQNPDHVRALAERCARLRDELGGSPVLSTAVRQVNKVKGALDGKDKALQSAASDLARRTSQVLYDSRRLNAAEHIGGLSLALAIRAGDDNAQARAYLTLSTVSAYQGNGERGALHAQSGLKLNDLAPSERAELYARLGRALSLVRGQKRQTRRALDLAQGFDGLQRPYLEAITGCIGLAMENLEAYDDADKYLSAAVRLHDSWSPLCQALYLGHQATTALRAGDPSMAADRMLTLGHLGPLVTSSQVNHLVSDILSRSATWSRVPEMRDARDQLRTAFLQDS